MKVIFIAPHSPQAVGYDSQQDFIEYAEYHHQYCLEVKKRGHEVEFWHLGPVEKVITHPYGHKIRQFKRRSVPTISTEISISLYRELIRSDADIIHFHSLHTTENWPSYLISSFIGHNIVAQNHGSALDSNKLSVQALYRILDILLPGDATITSVNKKELENIKDNVRKREFKYIPNGINTDKYKPSNDIASDKKELGLDLDEDHVLFVGRLTESKGVGYLMEAMADISATLLLVYGGADEDLLKEYKRQSPENVKFIGSVSNEDLVKYYSAAEVCAFPSINEGFGVVCLEAMSCETAIVGTEAHQEGGQNHLVDGENALVVRKKSSQELYKAINKLLSEDDFRHQIAQNGRKHVKQNFSWDIVGEQLMNCYINMIDSTQTTHH